MLKLLGFFVGALLVIWAFNKFVPKGNQEKIIAVTEQTVETVIEGASEVANNAANKSKNEMSEVEQTLSSDSNEPTVKTETTKPDSNDISFPESGSIKNNVNLSEIELVNNKPVEIGVFPAFGSRSSAMGFISVLEIKTGENLFIHEDGSGDFYVTLQGKSMVEVIERFNSMKVKEQTLTHYINLKK